MPWNAFAQRFLRLSVDKDIILNVIAQTQFFGKYLLSEIPVYMWSWPKSTTVCTFLLYFGLAEVLLHALYHSFFNTISVWLLSSRSRSLLGLKLEIYDHLHQLHNPMSPCDKPRKEHFKVFKFILNNT